MMKKSLSFAAENIDIFVPLVTLQQFSLPNLSSLGGGRSTDLFPSFVLMLKFPHSPLSLI